MVKEAARMKSKLTLELTDDEREKMELTVLECSRNAQKNLERLFLAEGVSHAWSFTEYLLTQPLTRGVNKASIRGSKVFFPFLQRRLRRFPFLLDFEKVHVSSIAQLKTLPLKANTQAVRDTFENEPAELTE